MFTVEAWALLKDPQVNNTITGTIINIGNVSADDENSGLELKVRANEHQLCAYYDHGQSVVATIPNMSGWHHIAVTVDLDAVKFYVDAEIIETRAIERTDSQIDVSMPDKLFSINPQFVDEIAELRLWNLVRTLADLKSFLYTSPSHNQDGLLTYLPFKGIPHDQALQRKCLLITSSDLVKSDNVILGDSDLPRASIEFWLNVNEASVDGMIFDYADAFTLSNAEHLTLTIKGQTSVIDTGVSLVDGHWHHLAVSWRSLSGYATIYVDGKEVSSVELAKGELLPASGSLTLGKQPFSGKLCELRIWNAFKDKTEVEQDMFFQQLGTEPDLLGYWPMDGDFDNHANFSKQNGIASNFMFYRNKHVLDHNKVDKFKVFVNSGLFIRYALIMQNRIMRDDRDRLMKFHNHSETPSTNNVPIKLESLVDKLNREITEARTLSEKGPYNLKDVQMEIKAIPNVDGSLILPDIQQLNDLSADQLTTINLNFVPELSTEKDTEAYIQQTVPDVRNYAQAIAVRKLEDAELTTKVSYQIVTDDNQVGFVVNQHPQVGEELPILSEVTIFVGKKQTEITA